MATFRDITSKPFFMLSPLSREECVSRLREAIDLPGEGRFFWKQKRFYGIANGSGLRIRPHIWGLDQQGPLVGTFIDYEGKTLIRCGSLINTMYILWLFCFALVPILAMLYYLYAYVSLFAWPLILVFVILAPLAYVFGALVRQRKLTDFLGTTIQARKVQRDQLGALDA
jgi:hypothetical protein